MPFQTSIDYAPDKLGDSWVGTIFAGPLAMTGTGDWSEQRINSDLSNIKINATIDYADSASNTPGNNNNIYSASLLESFAGFQTNANFSVLKPDYFRDLNSTKYARIIIVSSDIDRTHLFSVLSAAKAIDAEDISPDIFEQLQSVLKNAVSVYQNKMATQAQINAQYDALNAVLLNFVPNQKMKENLLELIDRALELKELQEAWYAEYGEDFAAAWKEFLTDPLNMKNMIVDFVADRPIAPYSYARIVGQIPQALAIYNNIEAMPSQIVDAYLSLQTPMLSYIPGYMPEPEDIEELGLTDLLIAAKMCIAEKYAKVLYTSESIVALEIAIDVAEELIFDISSGRGKSNITDIPVNIALLQAAIDGLRFESQD